MINKLQQDFQHWIMENWKENFHNFSKKSDGDYWYFPMQDAWEIWQAAYSKYYGN